jgi:hypothetical protein
MVLIKPLEARMSARCEFPFWGLLFFSIACGGAMRSGSDAGLVWWTTCGAPACAADAGVPDSGLPACPAQYEGTACADAGAQCDPGARCQVYLRCSATDPKQQPGGCPISRMRYKKDIRYLSGGELRAVSDELMALPLARYRYRSDDARERLGFMIDGHESLACVDAEHDQVDLYGYTSMAVAALKVQAEEIAELRRQVTALRATLAKRRR